MEFHGIFLAGIQWDLGNCQECHGTDYRGGITESSCITCHENTPEDCNVCHGASGDPTGAPPEDLTGNTSTVALGVGAHTAHLQGALLSDGVDCTACHAVPDSFASAGHIDAALPAELIFSSLALADGAQPIWNRETASCADSYCHGNWSLAREDSRSGFIYTEDTMSGSNAVPDWTDPESAACGTCHALPPNGHRPFDLSACSGCHNTVIDVSGNIIDKTKHINGSVNVFLQEFPIF